MSDKIVLQVPMSKQVKIEAQKAALDLGFSSLQETVRILLRKLAHKELTISVEEKALLSSRAERRYEKILRDIKSGKEKVYKPKNTKEFFKMLEEE